MQVLLVPTAGKLGRGLQMDCVRVAAHISASLDSSALRPSRMASTTPLNLVWAIKGNTETSAAWLVWCAPRRRGDPTLPRPSRTSAHNQSVTDTSPPAPPHGHARGPRRPPRNPPPSDSNPTAPTRRLPSSPPPIAFLSPARNETPLPTPSPSSRFNPPPPALLRSSPRAQLAGATHSSCQPGVPRATSASPCPRAPALGPRRSASTTGPARAVDQQQ